MKTKKIKIVVSISAFLLIFLIFLFLTFKPYNYEKKYVIDEFNIFEKYNKDKKYYSFEIEVKDKKFVFLVNSKYKRKKELIEEIEVYKSDKEFCILPKSDKIDFYPLCSDYEVIYTYNLSEIADISYNYKKIENIAEQYNSINIYTLSNASFLLYNYKGFYLINEKEKKEIKIFNKDVYSIDLSYQKGNYLIVPDYNQSYYFNKFYLINILNGKIKEIDLEFDISFDSIFLGDYKNDIYLLDKKEEKEYKIDLEKETVKEVEFQMLKEGKLVKTNFKNIINSELDYINNDIYTYEIIDEILYLNINNIKIKITDKKVNKIITNINETVYYLSNEKLYMYNNIYGEVLLLSNFEWNFNNTNMIYLYK